MRRRDLIGLIAASAATWPLARSRASVCAGSPCVAADPMIARNRRIIIDQSLMRNLPAMHSNSFEVQDGALMSYGSDIGEDYGRAAVYVDRILRGARIADLPFQERRRSGLPSICAPRGRWASPFPHRC